MSHLRITVLRKMANPDFADTYCRGGAAVCPCPAFEEGQTFVSDLECPDGFCDWAWDDIAKYLLLMRGGGNMGDEFGWMRENDRVIACCTDGIRPVVFRIERLEGPFVGEAGQAPAG